MSQQLAIFGPKKNAAFNVYVTLASPTDADAWITNPTIAAGDFKVSIDGGAFANVATLPAVTPAGGVALKITLSQAEMNGDVIVVVGKDQTSTEEWQAVTVVIYTCAVTVDELVRSATPANALAVDASGRIDVGKWLGTSVTVDSTTNKPDVNVDSWQGVVVTNDGTTNKPDVNVDSWQGVVVTTDSTTNKPDVNVDSWQGKVVATGATDLPQVDADAIDGSAAKATALASAIDHSNGIVLADIKAIGGSTAAVANMQDDYDGTGYAGGTIPRNANVTEVSGDSAAADNLEACLDGNAFLPVDVMEINSNATAAANCEKAFDGVTGYGFTGCTMPTVTSITDAVSIDMDQAVPENGDTLSVGWCLAVPAGRHAFRFTRAEGFETQFTSDNKPLITRQRSSTELIPTSTA